ncbi:MAG: hypothetical protein NZO58_13140, partial [Gemmataceae bacterium]|nr:hypothetical protein [Gemmataceae bacterium]
SMTCAGLLGLATGRGSQHNAKLSEGDEAIERALRFVGSRIGNPGEKTIHDSESANVVRLLQELEKQMLQANAQERKVLREKIRQIQQKQKAFSGERGRIVGANSWGDLYYLWSLERVAVAYDLEKIGGKDWYAWGAPIIVAHQRDDGSWREAHPGVPDTCFALLFLRRANVAADLTVRLQELALPKTVGERSRPTSDASRTGDTYGRRPDLEASQRQAAGFVRDRSGAR